MTCLVLSKFVSALKHHFVLWAGSGGGGEEANDVLQKFHTLIIRNLTYNRIRKFGVLENSSKKFQLYYITILNFKVSICRCNTEILSKKKA